MVLVEKVKVKIIIFGGVYLLFPQLIYSCFS